MNIAFEPKALSTSLVYYGSSVIGMKYKNGIVIACDTRLNYGSLGKFFNIEDRVQRINENTMLGTSGEYSDFQESCRMLKELALDDILDSKSFLGPQEITNYLSAMHYYKRNKMNPFLNSTVTGGIDWDGKPVLFSIDQFGTLLKADYITVGLAQYFGNSIISQEYPQKYEDISREQAVTLIEKCFKVLFYRDSRAGNRIKFGYMEQKAGGIEYNEFQIVLKTEWNYEKFRNQANEKVYLTN